MNTTRKIFIATAGALVLAATTGCSSDGAGNAASSKAASAPASTTTVTATATASSTAPSNAITSSAAPSSAVTSSTSPATSSTGPSKTAPTRTQTAPASAGVPTLGLKGWGSGRNNQGFGIARPGIIDNGGDPTGLVQKVTWSNWGGQTADGSGISSFIPNGKTTADAIQLPAKIRAYDLTTCGGHPAYRHVIWWFPSKGETYRSVRANGDEAYNLCTGN